MKKLFIFSFIFAIVMFYGCEVVNNPVEPENNYSVSSEFNATTCGSELVIDSDLVDICEIKGSGYIIYACQDYSNINFSDYELVNPKHTHFLLDMKELVDAYYIEFKNEGKANAYSNKLDVLIKMLEAENFKAAEQKGIHDVYKHTLTWITNEEQKQAFIGLLELTQYMIEHPNESIYHPLGLIGDGPGCPFYNAYFIIKCATKGHLGYSSWADCVAGEAAGWDAWENPSKPIG